MTLSVQPVNSALDDIIYIQLNFSIRNKCNTIFYDDYTSFPRLLRYNHWLFKHRAMKNIGNSSHHDDKENFIFFYGNVLVWTERKVSNTCLKTFPENQKVRNFWNRLVHINKFSLFVSSSTVSSEKYDPVKNLL